MDKKEKEAALAERTNLDHAAQHSTA